MHVSHPHVYESKKTLNYTCDAHIQKIHQAQINASMFTPES